MRTIRNLENRINALTLRERAIVFGGVLLILFLAWYTFLMEPLLKEETRLSVELENRRGQLQALNEQFMQMTQQAQDPDAANRRQLAELREQSARLAVEMKGATGNLIAPEVMPEVLREVLKSARGLSLVKLNGLGSAPLVQEGEGAGAGREDGAATGTGGQLLRSAYKHGMQIEFTGDFFSTLNYMRRLEELEWDFFWERLEFDVSEYPDARASIRVFTLSLDANWIGV